MKIFVDIMSEGCHSGTYTAMVLRLRRIIMYLSLEVEVLVGTPIERAALEARSLARKLDLAYVKFDFNGVSVSIGQHADVDGVKTKLMNAMDSRVKYVIENGE